jgi:CheY-like chemotaxis protein
MRTEARSDLRVLVVEDDVEIRQCIGEVLEDEGFAVTLAPHGRAALISLVGEAPRPHVILLDLMMPVMDGHRFREEQLKMPDVAAIPVIIMSADNGWHDRALAAAGGMRKPIDVHELLSLVRRVAALARRKS